MRNKYNQHVFVWRTCFAFVFLHWTERTRQERNSWMTNYTYTFSEDFSQYWSSTRKDKVYYRRSPTLLLMKCFLWVDHHQVRNLEISGRKRNGKMYIITLLHYYIIHSFPSYLTSIMSCLFLILELTFSRFTLTICQYKWQYFACEGWGVIHRELDKLQQWAHEDHMNFR